MNSSTESPFTCACMAANEPKTPGFLASKGLYTPLAGECDGQHAHEPWRITKIGTSLHYDTATEAEYPALLCKRMADLLADAVQLPQPPANVTTSRTSRRILGQHTKQAPPLVPEFSAIIEMDKEPSQANHKCLTSHLQGQNHRDEQHGPNHRDEQHSHAHAKSRRQKA